MSKKNRFQLSIVMAGLFLSASVSHADLPTGYAGTQNVGGTQTIIDPNTGATVTTTTDSSVPGLNSVSNTSIVMPTNMQNNIQNQGQQASQGQSDGSAAAMAAAAFSAMMAAMKSAQCPKPDPGACAEAPLWALGSMASKNAGDAMAGASNQSDQTVANVSQSAAPTGRPVSAPTIPTSELASIGVNANEKAGTVTFPDGRVVKASDVGNASALSASGMSASEIKHLQDIVKRALKEGAKQAGKGLDTAATGYGDSNGGAGSKNSKDAAANGGLGGINRDPAQVAGLTKDYNGDPIGVANENLFTLINRRYDFKAHQDNIFLLPPRPGKAQ